MKLNLNLFRAYYFPWSDVFLPGLILFLTRSKKAAARCSTEELSGKVETENDEDEGEEAVEVEVTVEEEDREGEEEEEDINFERSEVVFGCGKSRKEDPNFGLEEMPLDNSLEVGGFLGCSKSLSEIALEEEVGDEENKVWDKEEKEEGEEEAEDDDDDDDDVEVAETKVVVLVGDITVEARSRVGESRSESERDTVEVGEIASCRVISVCR